MSKPDWRDSVRRAGQATAHAFTAAATAVKESVFADEATRNHRRALCESCEFVRRGETKARCGKCGCPIDAKTNLKRASCPIDKW